jgi:hypothetical protein
VAGSLERNGDHLNEVLEREGVTGLQIFISREFSHRCVSSDEDCHKMLSPRCHPWNELDVARRFGNHDGCLEAVVSLKRHLEVKDIITYSDCRTAQKNKPLSECYKPT